ncbi:MAG: SxtJ family membrane protein [Candidatus Omnitrophota bacterium]|jgi:CBS domain containing-hemolysin-like protein
MEKIKTDNLTLRKFGLIMALALSIAALLVFIKHRQLAPLISVISVLFLLAGLNIPGSLKYFYIIWMKLAFVLSWFNTRLLLYPIFYLIFSPIGLIMRLFRVNLLERRIITGCVSYWKRKDKIEYLPENYEKQF